MINTGKFAGRTVVITGASRGIGKEIALKLARDGANIVVAAKTAEPHPKLPGTIYTAVEEIEKVGGKGLPCVVDVRDEESVMKAVSETVKKFGGIDILVNNASAISLTGTLKTTMKKYDLMHQINTRGTFLMSQKCIPHLKKGKNPHILNISPPLNMEKHWFANHVAYTMAKYGMSMCVLGMHEELRQFKIAVNALWPKTAIWTAAMNMISGGTAENECRKPGIVADAAYVMLARDSASYTGNFAVDEDILRQEGIRDFEQYAVKPGGKLIADFFLDEKWELQEAESEKANSMHSLDTLLDEVSQRITPDAVKKISAIYQFDVKAGPNNRTIYFDLKNGTGGIYRTLNASEHVDVRFATNMATLHRLLTGKISSTTAFSSGKFKIDGSMEKAVLLSQILKPSSKSKL